MMNRTREWINGHKLHEDGMNDDGLGLRQWKAKHRTRQFFGSD